MSTTLNTTWPELKQMASEFFKALPDLNEEEAENGFKCLSLGYLGLVADPIEEHQAALLIQIASTKFVEHVATL